MTECDAGAAGIFYKFVDFGTIPHLYPSAADAQKTTRHELNAASAVSESDTHARAPLSAYVDYLGFRLLAVIAMPLSSDTLLCVA